METQMKLPDKKKELSELSKRFLKVLEEKKYTGYKLAKEVSGITEAKITFIRTGRNEPSKTILDALLEKFPDVSMVWLLTGEGEMFNDGTMVPVKKLVPHQEPTGYYYPDVMAAAGIDKEVLNNELNKIPINIPNWGKDLDFINVFGDSMYPKFSSGEIIGIKEVEFAYIIYGFAYVVVLDNGDVYVKYIKKGSDNEHIILESENKFYEPKEFHLSQIKRIYQIKVVITKITM